MTKRSGKTKPDELMVPPEAESDPEAFEIMRLWAANQQLHVSLNSDLGGGAEDFGELLSDLFEHAARMYSQRDNVPVAHCRRIILRDFLKRTKTPKEEIAGGILPPDH